MAIQAQELVAGVETLMSLPAAYLNVKHVVEDPRTSTNDLAKAISADPALTARLLRIVNSPIYGFSGKIETVSRALVVLGTQQVHDLALATSVGTVFCRMSPKLMDMKRFWRQSVYCALAARALAQLCGVLDSERLFVAGLLHSIGHLVMYEKIPDQTAAARRHAQQSQKPIYRAQRELIGCDFAQVGTALLRRWNLPASLCAAIEYHLEPNKAPQPSLSEPILHVGYWLTHAALEGIAPERWHLPVSVTLWAQTGLNPECFQSVKAQADVQLSETLALLHPGQRRAA